MRIKYRKLHSQWRQQEMKRGDGIKPSLLPNSVDRAMSALHRKGVSARIGLFLKDGSVRAVFLTALRRSCTNSPRTHEDTFRPKTTEEFSSTISQPKEEEAPSSPTRESLEAMTRDELRELASERKIRGRSKLRKDQLVSALVWKPAE